MLFFLSVDISTWLSPISPRLKWYVLKHEEMNDQSSSICTLKRMPAKSYHASFIARTRTCVHRIDYVGSNQNRVEGKIHAFDFDTKYSMVLSTTQQAGWVTLLAIMRSIFRLHLLLLLLLILRPAFVGLIYGNRLRYKLRFSSTLGFVLFPFIITSLQHVHYGKNRNCNPLFSSEMNLMGKLRTGEKTSAEESIFFSAGRLRTNSFNIAELEHHEHGLVTRLSVWAKACSVLQSLLLLKTARMSNDIHSI